jgi:hypothetical protein
MEENKSIKSNLLNFNAVEEKIITIRNIQVIIDSDVATLYGVQTKEINQAVKNNPDKFPEGYLIEVDSECKNELVKNFDRFNNLKHSSVQLKAFTEKGLYMLATILKSPAATKTTIAIVEAFAKIRELSHIINELHDSVDDKVKHTVKRKSE